MTKVPDIEGPQALFLSCDISLGAFISREAISAMKGKADVSETIATTAIVLVKNFIVLEERKQIEGEGRFENRKNGN